MCFCTCVHITNTQQHGQHLRTISVYTVPKMPRCLSWCRCWIYWFATAVFCPYWPCILFTDCHVVLVKGCMHSCRFVICSFFFVFLPPHPPARPPRALRTPTALVLSPQSVWMFTSVDESVWLHIQRRQNTGDIYVLSSREEMYSMLYQPRGTKWPYVDFRRATSEIPVVPEERGTRPCCRDVALAACAKMEESSTAS